MWGRGARCKAKENANSLGVRHGSWLVFLTLRPRHEEEEGRQPARPCPIWLRRWRRMTDRRSRRRGPWCSLCRVRLSRAPGQHYKERAPARGSLPMPPNAWTKRRPDTGGKADARTGCSGIQRLSTQHRRGPRTQRLMSSSLHGSMRGTSRAKWASCRNTHPPSSMQPEKGTRLAIPKGVHHTAPLGWCPIPPTSPLLRRRGA